MGACTSFRAGQRSNCRFVQNVLAAKAFSYLADEGWNGVIGQIPKPIHIVTQ